MLGDCTSLLRLRFQGEADAHCAAPCTSTFTHSRRTRLVRNMLKGAAMFSLMLMAVLCADERLLSSELGAGSGVMGEGYTAVGARIGDALWAVEANARGVFSGFTAQ